MILRIALGVFSGVVVLIAAFVYFVPNTDTPDEAPAISDLDTAPEYAVTAHSVYSRGRYTITGTVEAPNPCTTVSVTAEMLASSTPPAIQLNISMLRDEGACLELITPTSFTATTTGPVDATLAAYVNGTKASVREP